MISSTTPFSVVRSLNWKMVLAASSAKENLTTSSLLSSAMKLERQARSCALSSGSSGRSRSLSKCPIAHDSMVFSTKGVSRLSCTQARIGTNHTDASEGSGYPYES